MNVGLATLAVGLALIVSGHETAGLIICTAEIVLTILIDAFAGAK